MVTFTFAININLNKPFISSVDNNYENQNCSFNFYKKKYHATLPRVFNLPSLTANTLENVNKCLNLASPAL